MLGQEVRVDPIMRVDVFVPDQYIGDVIGDLNARGGKIEAMESKAGMQQIRATAPLSRLFGGIQ